MLNFYRLNKLSSVLNSLTLRLPLRLSHSSSCIPIATRKRHIDNSLIKNSQPFVIPNRHICSSVKSLEKCDIHGVTIARVERGLGDMYPAIEPFNFGHLEVSSVHKIYYEQCGNKNGLPIVFVHGGPGGGISGYDRRYFDPQAYHIILFDQRGAGKSTPAFSLEENDTWSLVGDMEKLRTHLGVDRWILFGGSWGSTLSLAYAEKHIDRVLGMILRGIFTLRDEEIRWFYQSGASNIFPDVWEQYVAPIPENERDDFVRAYYKRLTGNDEAERLRCAKAWSTWEMATSQLKVNPENLLRAESDTWALAFARIECHFFINKGFMAPSQLIDNAHIIRNAKIPVTIVQGRYDVVCPAKSAWDLHKQLPEAEFFFIDDAGHSAKEEGTARKLVEACDKYKDTISKK